jgi:hypothetical protein
MTVIPFPRHKWEHCSDPECTGCALCRGGLAVCMVCRGGEGSLPTDCPGERMHEVVEDDVYAGRIDYRAGAGWVRRPA